MARLALYCLLSALIVSACAPSSGGETAALPTAPAQDPTAPEEPEATVDAPDPARGRDAALAYLAGQGQLDPPQDADWSKEDITPRDIVGAHSVLYTTSGWEGTVEVSMPVVAPQYVVYTVAVRGPASGQLWEVKVNAQGEVIEVSDSQAAQPEATPEASRDTAPQVSEADLQAVTGGNSAFAFDLYQALRGQEGNLFYSPYSISVALAMTYAGARAETEAQMAEVLHFDLPQAQLHPVFKALAQALADRGEGAHGQGGFQLNVANALWGQAGYAFLPEFLNLLDRNYGAGLRLVDFIANAEAARVTINDWVAEQTEGRIEDLIPPGVLDSMTRLVLTNAIYFNAAWAQPFNERATQEEAFHLLDGGQVMVPMMHQIESFGYAEGDGYQVVELPYESHELSMVVLLPDEGGFEALEGSLDAAQVEAMLDEVSYREVSLAMPRFKYDAQFSLAETLAGMGMPAAFSDGADFSGMTGTRELFISAVIHKAFVSVDEEGTEAAAATAVAMKLTAAQTEPVEVRLDRPFVFLIRDIETGTILFLGRVVDPLP
jgi:serpin B